MLEHRTQPACSLCYGWQASKQASKRAKRSGAKGNKDPIERTHEPKQEALFSCPQEMTPAALGDRRLPSRHAHARRHNKVRRANRMMRRMACDHKRYKRCIVIAVETPICTFEMRSACC